MSTGTLPKKPKGKKAPDASETSKLLAAKISQLESDKAGEKDQEAEIDREVKRANRDLSNLLSKIESPLSQLDAVQKKYTDLLWDMEKLKRDQAKSKKRADQMQKEKDQQRSELSKATALKEKLEKLSRELQKENKKLKDDQKQQDDSETIDRENLSFELTALLNKTDTMITKKPLSANLPSQDYLFKQKFKSFLEQYELREHYFHSVLRNKEAEVQVALANHERQRLLADHEAKRCRKLSDQVSKFTSTEAELRSQLNIYVEKFKQVRDDELSFISHCSKFFSVPDLKVEETLNNSNDLFLTFRREMEEMSKKTKRLEKENLRLTRQYDTTKQNIITMVDDARLREEETRKAQEENKKLSANVNTLKNLCRKLEDERKSRLNGEVDRDRTESEEEGEDEDDGDGGEGVDEDGGKHDEYLDSDDNPYSMVPHLPPHLRYMKSIGSAAKASPTNGDKGIHNNLPPEGHARAKANGF